MTARPAVLCAVWFLAAATLQPAGCTEPEVEFRLEVPDEVILDGDGAADFRVTGSLDNETGESVALEASTVCRAEDWRILDGDGTVVAKPPDVVCIQMLASRDLGDGETLPLVHQVEVPPGRLDAGQSYRLVFEFWHYSREANFRTVASGN